MKVYMTYITTTTTTTKVYRCFFFWNRKDSIMVSASVRKSYLLVVSLKKKQPTAYNSSELTA